MKYEFTGEINDDSSQGKLLRQIRPGSVVLECGCAGGHMTQYMKQQLGCSVYIAEKDPSGFEKALQFAADGICADLTGNEWYEKFSGLRFDYILFADVLEHLSDPLEVLKRAVTLLKDDGTVLVSLPNVGHNDILAKLWTGYWDYTGTGLLDDTHVHFWGVQNLDEFFRMAGLRITLKDCTCVKTMHTEQFDQQQFLTDQSILESLASRPEGEIYQFVLTLQKERYVTENGIETVDKLPKASGVTLDNNPMLELIRKDSVIRDKERHIRNLEAMLQREEKELERVQSTVSWKITAPLRWMLRLLKKILSSNRFTLLIAKGIRSLFRYGFSITWKKVKLKMATIRNSRNARVSRYTRRDLKAQRNAKFPKDIKFSILVPLYNTPPKYLRAMIQSVLDQTYSNWELCLADGSDEAHSEVGSICQHYAQQDHRIRYQKLEKNLGISGNTNACIDMATGDYISLFDHDDLLHPAALYAKMEVICQQDADFIYTDENTFHNKPSDAFCPHFKPDYAPDTLRANNYICHFTSFKRSLLDSVGRFRPECDGSQDFDMMLRLTEKAQKIVHIPQILYYWRAHPTSVAANVGAKPYVIDAAKRAIRDHLDRVGLKGEVLDSVVPSMYRLRYEIDGEPLVSIIIPNYEHLNELEVCLNSIYGKTTYKNFEVIIVENNSTSPEIFAYYREIQQKWTNLKVIIWNDQFNYSAINNFGARHASGTHLLLLNNDTEVISPDWIQEMLMYSQRSDVGAVGAKLYYPDGTIQHAGIGIGLMTLAAHLHRNFDHDSPGYMGRLIYAQNLSGVTAACIMIPKTVWEEMGGLDETLAVAFNDVDLCLRIRKAGYLIVWTPFAELYHYESKSRGLDDTPEKQDRFISEVQLMQTRWAAELEAGDPYYNPNFSRDRDDFSVR